MAHSFEDAALELPLRAWQHIVRRFRDGHGERWWAGELVLLHYGPGKPLRAVCVTTDRRALPELTTCYKQMKDELDWADFMVRSDRAIRRHWMLVCCAFAFCWWREAAEVRLHDAVTPAREKIQAPPAVRRRWPRLLRAWLTPLHWLARCGQAGAHKPPPLALAALIEVLRAVSGAYEPSVQLAEVAPFGWARI